MQPVELKSGDSDDLEALFDQIASERSESEGHHVMTPEEVAVEHHHQVKEILAPGDKPLDTENENYDVFLRLGQLTRTLHDALRQLGYDKNVETAVNALPDARARLNYIANLTGQAAEKVLSTVEQAQVVQDDVQSKAKRLDAAWDKLFNQELSLDEFKAHALDTHQFLKTVQASSQTTNSYLTDIMMAQDFHDLTGQVVNRIATMAQNLEEQLVRLLLDTTPPERRGQVDETWLSGPTIDAAGRSDVCGDQGQVDDLLESLGF